MTVINLAFLPPLVMHREIAFDLGVVYGCPRFCKDFLS